MKINFYKEILIDPSKLQAICSEENTLWPPHRLSENDEGIISLLESHNFVNQYLTQKEREVLKEVVLTSKSVKEVAAQKNISRQAVEKTLRKIALKAKNLLDSRND